MLTYTVPPGGRINPVNAHGELILGIESSCDETAAAVVAGGQRILSNIVASQVAIHRKYGGVVPELASREHLRRIVPVVREALEEAGVTLPDVDAIAVTRGPGLIGALLVGVTYGKVLAQALGKPLIAVNHLEGHVHAVLLEARAAGREPQLPAVCLIVSGGHTILYHVRCQEMEGRGSNPAVSRDLSSGVSTPEPQGILGGRSFSSDFQPPNKGGASAPEVHDLPKMEGRGFNPAVGRDLPSGVSTPEAQGILGGRSFSSDIQPPNKGGASAPEVHDLPKNGAARFSYTRIGGTRDDAAGEAYDKVARMLALGYPGGPIIDQLAPHGNARAIRFGEPKMRGNPYDFSFSGIKTAILYHLRAAPNLQPEIEVRRQALARGERSAEALRALASPETLDLVASFQHAVVSDLVNRTLGAAEQHATRTVLVSGGVAANRELRATFEAEANRRGLAVYFPSRALSTDNAAMIAAAAHPRLLAGLLEDSSLNAEANLPLA
jgi:tRNA A37 threonylcarbamoyltransferase TsaD